KALSVTDANSVRPETPTSGASAWPTASWFLWAEWGRNHEDDSDNDNDSPDQDFADVAAVCVGTCIHIFSFCRISWWEKSCHRRGGRTHYRSRQHASRGGTALSRQLRPLSQRSPEISAAHDVDHSPPHARPGDH